MWRDPTAEEAKILALAEIDGGLKQFELAYSERLLRFKLDSIEFIGTQIAKGNLKASDITGADAFSTFPGREQARDDLLRILGDIADFGSEQIDAELARQGVEGESI
jgi:hypothetical protein